MNSLLCSFVETEDDGEIDMDNSKVSLDVLLIVRLNNLFPSLAVWWACTVSPSFISKSERG